jgi:hypothetical protein
MLNIHKERERKRANTFFLFRLHVFVTVTLLHTFTFTFGLLQLLLLSLTWQPFPIDHRPPPFYLLLFVFGPVYDADQECLPAKAEQIIVL